METKITQATARRHGKFHLALFAFSVLGFLPAFPQPQLFAPPVLNPYGIVENSDTGLESSVLFTDIDLDGVVEAFVEIYGPGQGGQDLLFYENNGSNEVPLFSPRAPYPFQIANEPGIRPRQFVDIDGDGRQDLVFWAWERGARVRVQRNAGSSQHPEFDGAGIVENPYGIVLPKTPLMSDHILDAVTPTFVDIDSDGDYDLFYGGAFFNGEPDEGYYFARNNGPTGPGAQPRFGLPERNPFGLSLPVANYHRSSFVDQDCDGDLDLYTFIDGAGLFYHENTGSPAEPAFSEENMFHWPLESYDRRFRPTAGGFLDINGDADMDLICGSETGVYFFRNDAEQEGAACFITPAESRKTEPGFTLYPNPAGDLLTLEMEEQNPGEVTILNLAGQAVLQQNFSGRKLEASLGSLPPGIYVIKVRQGRQWASGKFVKQ